MKRENPLTGGGGLLLIFGALAFFPPIFNYELLILSWLGSMAQPVGLSAMVIGGILFAIGKLQDFRNSSPVQSPTDLTGAQPSADAQAEPQPTDQPVA
jgi:hypothetical protein